MLHLFFYVFYEGKYDYQHLFKLERAIAIYAPRSALFLISSTFETEDSPSVISFIFFNKYGVILAPEIPYSLHSLFA